MADRDGPDAPITGQLLPEGPRSIGVPRVAAGPFVVPFGTALPTRTPRVNATRPPHTGEPGTAMRPAQGRATTTVRTRRRRVLRLPETAVATAKPRNGGPRLPVLARVPNATGVFAVLWVARLSGPRTARRAPLRRAVHAGVADGPRLVLLERLPPLDEPAAPSV